MVMPPYPPTSLRGHSLHIVQRGINREPCFFAEEDYHSYLYWLEHTARACDCALHAYVLMHNHVHLLVTPKEVDAASELMRSLSSHYAQYTNRFYRRSGRLWEERHASSVVQGDGYLLACQRHIELNPVRAGIVGDPGEYPWSSYRANGLGQVDVRLTPHERYLSLGGNVIERQAVYRALVRRSEPQVAAAMA
jgi:putative transposase